MRAGDEVTFLKQIENTIHLELPKISSPTTDFPYTSHSQYIDEFYEMINSEGMICGPMDVAQASTRIVSHFRSHSMAEPFIWLRPCVRKAVWYKINVNYLSTNCDRSIALCEDSTFYTVCGNLVSMIETAKKVSFYYATDYPKEYIEEANGRCSLCLHIITVFINYSLFLFGLLHIHILIFLFCLLQYSTFIQRNPKWLILICVLLALMAVVTSFTVAYAFIYFGFYEGFQSWMVAYIAWISIQWIEEGSIRILFSTHIHCKI